MIFPENRHRIFRRHVPDTKPPRFGEDTGAGSLVNGLLLAAVKGQ